MKGNFQVRFLGEGAMATSPPYPTPAEKLETRSDPDSPGLTPTPRDFPPDFPRLPLDPDFPLTRSDPDFPALHGLTPTSPFVSFVEIDWNVNEEDQLV